MKSRLHSRDEEIANINNWIDIIHHINGLKDKNLKIILLDGRKTDKIQHLFRITVLEILEM